MEEDTEFKKLPVEERCVHKLWKARLNGYEEAIKIFREIDDEKSPEWNKFINLIKKFVVDSHAMAQERGLEATLLFVENCANAGKIAGDVVAGIVSKCIAASKTKIRELSVQVILMFIEIEKQEIVVEELVKGMDAKNPKTVAACIAATAQALREYGNKVVSVKAFIKKLPALLSDRDKGVRDETKQLTIEIFKWIGPALKPQLSSLTQVVLSELEGEFEKHTEKVQPTRYLRSQQEIKAKESIAKDQGDSAEVEYGTEEAVDPLEFVEAIDVLSQIPKDFYTKLEAKKWQERKEALEALEVLLKNPKLQTGEYGELVKALKKVLSKDTNVVLVALAGKLLAALANGLRKNFSPYAAACIPAILEKFKEKKTNVVANLRDAIDAIFPSTSFETILEDILEALNNKNPNIKTETALFLARASSKTPPSVFNKKLLKALVTALLKTLNEPDPTVRDASADALGTLTKLLGEKPLAPLLTDVDPLKLAKIKESAEKVVITVKIVEPKVKKPASSSSASNLAKTNDAGASKETVKKPLDSATFKKKPVRGGQPTKSQTKLLETVTRNSEPNADDEDDEQQPNGSASDVVSRTDISSFITEAILTELSDKNWKVKYEALIKLQGIIKDAKNIKPSIGDLAQPLAQRLIDSNAKVAQAALSLCQTLAESLGPGCKQSVKLLFPGFLNGLGDSKPYIRSASLTCINTWGDQCGYKEFFDGEIIADALKTGTPVFRAECWTWVAGVLTKLDVKTVSRDELLACVPHLYSNICDRNADVRKNANDAIYAFMLHLGYESMVKALEKMKPTSKKDILAALDKTRPNLPVKPLPKSKQQAPIIEEAPKQGKLATCKSQKSIPVSKGNSASSRKKDEDIDTSPLLSVNNLKNQRLIDEQKMKILRWTFTSPREEFTDLLKDQMTASGVNKNLIANMFHDDFRYHLKAIDSLLEDLPGNNKALISNLDLILKWISLRLYDTNPSVLLKGLDYLNFVFAMLLEKEYFLAENESSCFIPHLLIKIGDPKDAVRNSVRNLFRQLCLIYPFAKVFSYIMEGLKSKNARQRTECLDELGYLIETYGVIACQPTPQIALKEIARHISDRDNSVRSAALNAVVNAYFLIGDKIYKLIGQLSEKDNSMLDERIKRAKKTRKPVEGANKSGSGKTIEDVEEEEDIQIQDKVVEEPKEIGAAFIEIDDRPPEPEPHLMQPVKTQSKGPFRLDPDVIDEIERNWVKSNQLPKAQYPDIDISYLYTPLKIGFVNGVRYPEEKLKELIEAKSKHQMPGNYNISPPKKMVSLHSTTSPRNLANELPKVEDPNLMRILNGIASTDLTTARAALNELGDIIDSPDRQAALKDYEEIYVDSICCQLRNLSQMPIHEASFFYQPLLASNYSFFTSTHLGKNIGVDWLKKLISVLLGLMADHKFSIDDPQYAKVINGLCLRILDRANFTHMNCALIRLLKETCSSAGLPKFIDLLMKCIWRNVKNMPDRSQELNYEVVLMEIHDFMTALPTVWWTQRPSDTPLRTVKTIIHNMTKIQGQQILCYVNGIPETSELHLYILKVLKNNHQQQHQHQPQHQHQYQQQQQPQQQQQQQQQHHHHHQQQQHQLRLSGNSPQFLEYKITKQTHETLSNILKLISNKETGQEGIEKLYEFKTQNSNIDIAPFLKGSNPVFQKYIEESLSEIERSRKKQESLPYKSLSTNNSNPKNKSDPDYWMEKLVLLRNKANITQKQLE